MSQIKFHQVEQRSEEWRELRLGKITGTRLKAVLAKNNLPLIDELIAEKLTEQVEEVYVNEAMQRGIDMEPIGFEAYTAETNQEVHEIGFVTNSDYGHCGLSPDGFIGSNGAIELKCPSSKVHIEYVRTNKVPAKYRPQVLMYLIMCPDLEWVDFVSFDPRVTIKPINIVRTNRADILDELETVKAELDKFCEKLDKYFDLITF
jgi:putative phage-type endonuclease